MIVLFLVFIGLVVFFEIFIKFDHPKELDIIKNDYSNDKSIIDSLGQVVGYEYNFNKNDLKKDTLDFKIHLTGRDRNLFINGKLIKLNQNIWIYDSTKFAIRMVAK